MAAQRRSPSRSGEGKRSVGRILEGFVQGFLPTWQYQQEDRRAERRLALSEEEAKRQERRDVMSDAASQGAALADQWGTKDEFLRTVDSLAALNPNVPIEDIEAQVMSRMPSDTRRESALMRGLGDDAGHVSPEVLMSRMAEYGMDQDIYRTLPGSIPTADKPAPFLTVPTDSTRGELIGNIIDPTTGKSALDTSTPGWGGSAAQRIEGLQEGFRETEQSQREFARGLDADDLRERLDIEREVARDWFPDELLREIERIRSLGVAETQVFINRLEREREIIFSDDQRRFTDPKFVESQLKMEFEIATIRAMATNEPTFFDRLMPNGDVATVMMNRGPTGKWRFTETGSTLPGSPYSAYAQMDALDPVTDILRERVSRNASVDLTNPVVQREIIHVAQERGMPPDQAVGSVAAIAHEQQQSRQDPTRPATVMREGAEPDVPDVVPGGSDAASEIFGDDSAVTPASQQGRPGSKVRDDQNKQALTIATVVFIPKLEKELAEIEQQLRNIPPELRDGPEFKARNILYNEKFRELQEMKDAVESGEATDSMMRGTRPGLGLGLSSTRRYPTR
jgi:hypothetical protein